MAQLSASARKKLPHSDFALPGRGKGMGGKGPGAYPIKDKGHARSALQRVAQHGSPAEKSQVRKAVKKKFPSIKQGQSAPISSAFKAR